MPSRSEDPGAGPTDRRTFLVGAGMAGAAGIAGPLLRRTARAEVVPSSAPGSAPRDVYMVNYYPVNHGGYSMWPSPNYDGAQYESDMRTAKGLGFNTIRIFLAAKSGVFDFPDPGSTTAYANLKDFYSRATAAGMRLHVTLFDFWQNYGLVAGAETWTSKILGAFPDFTNIQCIELQNETAYASKTAYSGGFDSGWTGARPTTTGATAIGWAERMVPYIRSRAPRVPVTTSCTNGTPDIAAYYHAVAGRTYAPDWYEWHCYTGNAGTTYRGLQEVLAVVPVAKLFIGETGADSTPPSTSIEGPAQGLQAQADYIQSVRWSCQRLGLNDPAIWILFDMKPDPGGQFPGGQTFGLYTTSRHIKPAGQMIANIPLGAVIPPVGIDGNMLGPLQPDKLGNRLPAEWSVYKGNNGHQPIKAMADTTTTYRGSPSILLTGSAGTLSSDNPPALLAQPCTLPLISGQAGKPVTFSIALKASGSYSHSPWPNLEISWYSMQTGYISSVNGPRLTLDSTFTVFALKGTIPAGADYARLFVNVGHNAGSIWAAGATWSGRG